VDSWILWSVGFSGLGLDHQGTGRGYVVSLERGFLWGMGFSGLGLGHQGTWRGFVASLGWNWAARAQGVDSWILWSVGFSGAWVSLERGFLWSVGFSGAWVSLSWGLSAGAQSVDSWARGS